MAGRYTRLVLAVALVTAVSGGDSDKRDYGKLRETLKKRVDEAEADLKQVSESITRRAETIETTGKKILEDFNAQLLNLNQQIKNKATGHFFKIIQEYLNTTIKNRQMLIKIINAARSNRGAVKIEIRDGEKLSGLISGIYDGGGSDESVVAMAMPHAKALIISRDRVVETNSKVTQLEKMVKGTAEKVEANTKKLLSYRYMLEIVIKSRDIVVASKKKYMTLFRPKNRILNNYNEADSLVMKGKVLMGEARRLGFYKVEQQKIEKLYQGLVKVKEEAAAIGRKAAKIAEETKENLAKAEKHEGYITAEGISNMDSPNTGYSKSKDYYGIIVKLKGLVEDGYKKMLAVKQNSDENIKGAYDIIEEMDQMIERMDNLGNAISGINMTDDGSPRRFEASIPGESTMTSSESELLAEVRPRPSPRMRLAAPEPEPASDTSDSEDQLLTELKEKEREDRAKLTKAKRPARKIVRKRRVSLGKEFRKPVKRVRRRSESESSDDVELDEREPTTSSLSEFEKEMNKGKKGPVKKAMKFLSKVFVGAVDGAAQGGASGEESEEETESDERVKEEGDKAVGEIVGKLNTLKVGGKATKDIIKLVDMSQALKKQFEVVKDQLEKQIKGGAAELIKGLLMQSLHLYLTGVCSIVLDMTGGKVAAGRAVFGARAGGDKSPVSGPTTT